MPFNFDSENETTVVDFGEGDVCVGSGLVRDSGSKSYKSFPFPLAEDTAVTVNLADIGQSCCIGSNIPKESGIPQGGVTKDRCVTLRFPVSVEGMQSARVLFHSVLRTLSILSTEIKAKEGIPYVPSSDKHPGSCIFCQSEDDLYHIKDFLVCSCCIESMHYFITSPSGYQEYLNEIDQFTQAQHNLHNCAKEAEEEQQQRVLDSETKE